MGTPLNPLSHIIEYMQRLILDVMCMISGIEFHQSLECSISSFRFTPDFTTSRLTRTLRLVTSMNNVLEFTLLATLPHHLLALCSSTLPRPVWEPYLHIVAALGMSAVFVFVIIWAYLDAQKYVLQCTFGANNSGTVKVGRVSEIYTPGAVFNLNSITGMNMK